MRKQFRLQFRYTDLEWEYANKLAKEQGYNNLQHYITKKLIEFEKSTELPPIDDKIKSKRRVYYPNNEDAKIAQSISKMLCISPSLVVAKLIINPLLHTNKKKG
jgi:hypothetical protein